MKANIRMHTLVILLGALATANVHAAAGFVQFVSGEARIIPAAGGERAAQKGAEVNEGDTLVTGRGASVQLRMTDEGLIAVRPDSQLKIETYQYFGSEDGRERGVLALARGGFRTLTGFIGRSNKNRLLVLSPSATIGIRGTDHEIVHIPVPGAGETALGVPGTYNKVNVGETYMESKAGRIDLGPNQVGFAALALGVAPARLDAVPPFLRATQQQQGRDDRRQVRESSPNDQRRIAQEPQQQQQQQKQALGSTGGARREQNQPIGFHQQPPPPKNEVPIKTSDQGISLASTTQALKIASDRTVVVGGDFSNSNGVGGVGSSIQGETGSIFFGQDGQVALVTRPSDGFSYTRSGAPNVAPGRAVLNDGGTQIGIQWGIYAGGSIVGTFGARAVRFYHFMNARGTPLAVANTLTGSYSNVLGSTALITENGVLGGAVTSVNITVNNGRLTGYNIHAVDAQTRTWAGNCQACANTTGVALTQFASSGVGLAGTGAGAGALGKAQGAPVGPSGAGMVSSFYLRTLAGQAVTGAFVAQ